MLAQGTTEGEPLSRASDLKPNLVENAEGVLTRRFQRQRELNHCSSWRGWYCERPTRFAAVLLIGLGILLAACGGGGGTDAVPASDSTADDTEEGRAPDLPELDVDLSGFLLDEYEAPEVMDGIYSGEYSTVSDDTGTRAIVLGLVRALNDFCGEERFVDITAYMRFAGVSTEPSQNFLDVLEGILAARDTVEQTGDPFAGLDAYYEEIGLPGDLLAPEGYKDGKTLVDLYECDSSQVSRFRSNLDDFVVSRANGTNRSSESSGSDSSSADGSTVSLNNSHVRDFFVGLFLGSALGESELEETASSGQQVLQCEYGPTDPAAGTGFRTYGFWYEDVPDNIDALLSAAREGGGPAPVFHLGRQALEECPESMAEADVVWSSGRG